LASKIDELFIKFPEEE